MGCLTNSAGSHNARELAHEMVNRTEQTDHRGNLRDDGACHKHCDIITFATAPASERPQTLLCGPDNIVTLHA